MRKLFFAILMLFVPVAVQAGQKPSAGSGVVEPKTKDPAKDAGDPKLSDAEKVIKFQRVLDKDTDELAKIRKQLDDPASEFAKAEAALADLDKQWQTRQSEIKELKDKGKTAEANKLEKDSESLKKQVELARERLDLTLDARKIRQQMAKNLEAKNLQTKAILSWLRGDGPRPNMKKEAEPQPIEPQTKKESVPEKKVVPSPLFPGTTVGQAATTVGDDKKPDFPATVVNDKELMKAKKEAQVKEEAAQLAKEKLDSLRARRKAVEELVRSERATLENLRKRADIAYQLQATLTQEFHKRIEENAPQKERQERWQKLEEVKQEVDGIRKKTRETTTRLGELQDELASVQSREIEVLRQSESKEKEAAEAKETVESLQNPFAPANISRWLMLNGPRALAILLGIWLLNWIVRKFSRRMVGLLGHQGGRGTRHERENRADTLVSVFRNAASLFILVGGALILLDAVGIPIVPLMGGAAVIGLAVAFGAQNLVKDYFSGFMVLMEDQYGINDIVRIGSITGLVERISLRMTVLRDLEGTVHFIPHGTIVTVSNLTHSWSRALFEISVAYKEDIDRVMAILMELAKEMRRDPIFGHLVLDDPEMLGLDAFGDSGILIKFFIKTVPTSQWRVKRELNLRIKRRFDELGIEIPFPHRTLYVHHENGNGSLSENAYTHSITD